MKHSVFRRLAALFLATSISGWATSWTEMNSGLPHIAVGAATIVSDPLSLSTIYAISTAGSLFKSTDGSGNWKSISGVTAVSSLVIDPSNSSIVYAATSHGVEKSVDGLHTWGLQLAIDPANSSTICVSYVDLDGPLDRAQPHMLKTVDGGVSWTPLDTAVVSGMITSLLVDPINTSTLYAGYHTLIDSSWGIAKRTDGGASWTGSDEGLPPGYNVLALAVDSITPSTLYTSYFDEDTGVGGIFKSTDGGASWKGANAGPSIIDATALAVEPGSPNAIYAAAGHDGVSLRIFQPTTYPAANVVSQSYGYNKELRGRSERL